MIVDNPFQEPVIYNGDSVIFFKEIIFIWNSHDSRHNLQKSQALKKKRNSLNRPVESEWPLPLFAKFIKFCLNVIFIQMLEAGVSQGKKYWFKTFFKFNWCFGECFPLICYNTLICICYITLLYMLINKFTTAFSGEKVPRTPVVLTIMAIQFRKKKWNQSGDIYFIENIPKTSEIAAHVLQCEFFLKAPL